MRRLFLNLAAAAAVGVTAAGALTVAQASPVRPATRTDVDGLQTQIVALCVRGGVPDGDGCARSPARAGTPAHAGRHDRPEPGPRPGATEPPSPATTAPESPPAASSSRATDATPANSAPAQTAPTHTTPPPSTPAQAAPPPGTTSPGRPAGPAGSWRLAFDDEFDGTALDTSKWQPYWYSQGGSMNDVGTYASNVSVGNGDLTLTLSSASSGALVHTDIPGGYRFTVGSYVEARIRFPGNGSQLYNWPAWWASSTDGTWPSSGEHDIAEVLSGGDLTVNYHSPSGAHNQGAVPGNWGNQFHTYGLYRFADHADVYWDGVKVASYPTDDNGQPEILILNVGRTHGSASAYGPASAVQVDWVRAWTPG